MASRLSLPPRRLSWFKRLSALQAIPFGTGGYESAKWAYSLWRELLDARFHPQPLFHQRRQITETRKKWKKCKHHSLKLPPGFLGRCRARAISAPLRLKDRDMRSP